VTERKITWEPARSYAWVALVIFAPVKWHKRRTSNCERALRESRDDVEQ